jgi:hypothetical protein
MSNSIEPAMPTEITNDLPPAIARHLAACNGHDIDAWMATFDPDALVNDVQREFAGAEAIRASKERGRPPAMIRPRKLFQTSVRIIDHRAPLWRRFQGALFLRSATIDHCVGRSCGHGAGAQGQANGGSISLGSRRRKNLS